MHRLTVSPALHPHQIPPKVRCAFSNAVECRAPLRYACIAKIAYPRVVLESNIR